MNNISITSGTTSGADGLTRIPKVGILGNSITLAKSASTLTLSGAKLTGGTDDVGAKVITQLESSYKGTPKFNGVAFSPIQVSSADPNTLDDYEEGTWTPVFAGSIVAGTQTYIEQTGRYQKVGNSVKLFFDIEISAKDASSFGYIKIVGMPFLARTDIQFGGAVGAFRGLSIATGFSPIGLQLVSGNVLRPIQFPINGTDQNISFEFTAMNGSTLLCGSIAYETA